MWRKYDYISLEFSNQIVCHRRQAATDIEEATPTPSPAEVKEEENKTEDNKKTEDKKSEDKKTEDKKAKETKKTI